MAHLDHRIEQITSSDTAAIFSGLEDVVFYLVLPDGSESFRTTGTPVLECIGLLAIRQPMEGQFRISTSLGPVYAPTGTTLISEELPAGWRVDADSHI